MSGTGEAVLAENIQTLTQTRLNGQDGFLLLCSLLT
jgi:hypothetical protein